MVLVSNWIWVRRLVIFIPIFSYFSSFGLNPDVKFSISIIGGSRLTPIISIKYSCCCKAIACVPSITRLSCPFAGLVVTDDSNFTKQRYNYRFAHIREIRLERLWLERKCLKLEQSWPLFRINNSIPINLNSCCLAIQIIFALRVRKYPIHSENVTTLIDTTIITTIIRPRRQ